MEITIRAADRADYAAFTRLFAELGVPDPVPGPEKFVERFAPQMSVAADLGGNVVGYITWRPYGETAHVVQLAVDPEVRGRRIGERMLEHVRGLARAAGCTRWYLNVKRGNEPALKLYDRVGLRFELEAVTMKLLWAGVPRVAVDHRLAREDEFAALSARFGMPIERIAMFHARGSAIIVLLEAGEIVGFAPFDPGFPGAPGLGAARPQLALALLEAMRHHADPKFDHVRLTVEGDRALADALIALGAEVSFEILRLSAAF